MFKIMRNELKCAGHSSVVRIPGEGLGNWEGAVLQCFDTKTPSGVTLQGLLAQTSLGFYCFFSMVNVCALLHSYLGSSFVRLG